VWITTPDHHKIISKVSHFCLFCKIGREAYGALQNEGWICCTPSSNSRLSLYPLSTKPSRAQIWATSTSTQKFKKGYHIIYRISKDVRDSLQVLGFNTEGHMFKYRYCPLKAICTGIKSVECIGTHNALCTRVHLAATHLRLQFANCVALSMSTFMAKTSQSWIWALSIWH
jgi:hypothetical protein